MNDEPLEFAGFQSNPGSSADSVDAAEKALQRRLPEDYRSFLIKRNGGEGFIGNSYVILFRVEELAQFNREYEVDKYAPGLILFGSNGGGEGFAFDGRKSVMPIVQIPFVGMELTYADFVADGFSQFLSVIQDQA